MPNPYTLHCQLLNAGQPHTRLKTKKVKGFTLIELLTVIFILGVLAAISLPNLLKQVSKARIAEAKNNLGVINRGQQAYYFEKTRFADSLTTLNIDFTVGSFQGGTYKTDFYQYSVDRPPTRTEVHHLATPIAYTNDINAVASAIFRIDDSFKSLLCEANDVLITPDITDLTTCDNGSFVK